MKKFNQVKKKPGRKIKRHELIAGAAIFLFVLLHFISPFIFVGDKQYSDEISALKDAKIADEQSAPATAQYKPEIVTGEEPEHKAQNKQENAEAIKASDPFAIAAKPVAYQPKIAPRPTLKKKEPARESRAERLRRAERILTGV